MTDVLLVTFAALPAGEEGAPILDAALAARDIEARWVVWDDPEVAWAEARLVAVRSTWDYPHRLEEFLAWARRVERETRLLNGAACFAWNADKRYLAEGLGDVPVVPTLVVDEPAVLARAAQDWGTIVVKPRVGAGGVGLIVVDRADDPRLAAAASGGFVAQPLVESIRTRGETSVFVLGGRAVSQVDKVPATGEVRVHEEYGGASRAVPLDPDAADLALAALDAATARLGRRPEYARVDLVEHAGALAVSELELIEPGLYLDISPAAAEPFAEVVRLALSEVEC